MWFTPQVPITVIGTDHRIVSQVVNRAEGVASMVIRRGCLSAWRALRQVRPDVVQVNLSQVNGSRALIVAAILLRLPIVAVDHGPAPGLSWRGRMLQRVFSSRIAARVSVSDQSARDVENTRDYPEISSKRFEMVFHEEPCPPAPPGNELTVRMLARLDPVKGIDLTIRASRSTGECATGGWQERGPRATNLLTSSMSWGSVTVSHSSPRSGPDGRVRVRCRRVAVTVGGLPLVLLEAMHAHRIIVSNVGAMAGSLKTTSADLWLSLTASSHWHMQSPSTATTPIFGAAVPTMPSPWHAIKCRLNEWSMSMTSCSPPWRQRGLGHAS